MSNTFQIHITYLGDNQAGDRWTFAITSQGAAPYLWQLTPDWRFAPLKSDDMTRMVLEGASRSSASPFGYVLSPSCKVEMKSLHEGVYPWFDKLRKDYASNTPTELVLTYFASHETFTERARFEFKAEFKPVAKPELVKNNLDLYTYEEKALRDQVLELNKRVAKLEELLSVSTITVTNVKASVDNRSENLG